MPTLAVIIPEQFETFFTDALRKELPGFDVRGWSDHGDPKSVEYALVSGPTEQQIAAMPNLKCLMAIGAGADHILRLPNLPDIPIARLAHDDLRNRMTEYVVLHTLRHHRQHYRYVEQQKQREWAPFFDQPAAPDRTVGIMGLGVLGLDAADKLTYLGFNVKGWSRGQKDIKNVETFSGTAEFQQFLSQTEILVSLLPETPETNNLLNAKTLYWLPRGASVINAGRGNLIDEDALIAALDDQQLSEATLDVFAIEPLPRENRLWTHPRVTITPHNASLTLPKPVARMVADTVERIENGQLPQFPVDARKGY